MNETHTPDPQTADPPRFSPEVLGGAPFRAQAAQDDIGWLSDPGAAIDPRATHMECHTVTCADAGCWHRDEERCRAPVQIRLGSREGQRGWRWAVTMDGRDGRRYIQAWGSARSQRSALKKVRRAAREHFDGTAARWRMRNGGGGPNIPHDPPPRAHPRTTEHL